MTPAYINEKYGIVLYQGDCREVLASLPESVFDSVITDPPYELGFMGKSWDSAGVSFLPSTWAAAMRVGKPGATMLAFGGTRTFHRIACAIEDAGWEMRDCLMWLYGTGFPKSMDISKAIDKSAGAEREVVGSKVGLPGYSLAHSGAGGVLEGRADGSLDNSEKECQITVPATPAAMLWNGYGTALKPAWEPVILAMKELDGTFAQNAERHGVAGLNIEECRIEYRGDVDPRTFGGKWKTGKAAQNVYEGGYAGKELGVSTAGRFPANLLLDESAAVMLDEQAKELPARFFYCAKSSKSERGAYNKHPTVKPLALMQYLVRLLKTPTGGSVLDPFMGSGTTALACIAEGREFVGIEQDAENFATCVRRVEEFISRKEAGNA